MTKDRSLLCRLSLGRIFTERNYEKIIICQSVCMLRESAWPSIFH